MARNIFKSAREIIIEEGAWDYSVSREYGVLDKQAMLGYLSELSDQLNTSINNASGHNLYPDLDGFLQFSIEKPKEYTMAELELLCDEHDIQCMEEFKTMKTRLEGKLRTKILQAMFRGDIKDKAGNIALQNIYGYADNTRAAVATVPTPAANPSKLHNGGELVDFSKTKSTGNTLDKMRTISASFEEVKEDDSDA